MIVPLSRMSRAGSGLSMLNDSLRRAAQKEEGGMNTMNKFAVCVASLSSMLLVAC